MGPTPPVNMLVPFPCVVYQRDRAGVPYQFSHFCDHFVVKKIPGSLSVTDLREHDHLINWNMLRNACFLVLVAGDVGQCISVSSAGEKRPHFLFHGSKYSKIDKDVKLNFLTEFHEGFVPVILFGTLSSFDKRGRYRSTIPLEAAVCLFPKVITESEIPKLTKWIESAILKSIHSSVWITDLGSSYNEHTLRESTRGCRV
jgi:hypothetical protein